LPQLSVNFCGIQKTEAKNRLTLSQDTVDSYPREARNNKKILRQHWQATKLHKLLLCSTLWALLLNWKV